MATKENAIASLYQSLEVPSLTSEEAAELMSRIKALQAMEETK